MFIYKITNSITGKIYVGQTKRSLKQRFEDHISSALYDKTKGSSAFHSSIKKHGKQNFVIELLEETINLNEREQFWIKELNTISPNGYNLKSGGQSGCVASEEFILKISKPIKCFNTITNEYFYFISLTKLSTLGYSPGSVSWAIKNKKEYKGYSWEHCSIEEYLTNKNTNDLTLVPKFYAKSPDGDVIEFFMIQDVSKYNLSPHKVTMCLNKYAKYKSHRGWIFNYSKSDLKLIKNKTGPKPKVQQLPTNPADIPTQG